MVDTLPPNAHTIILAVGDLSGIARGKRIHASMWETVAERGIAMANAIFVLDMTCDIWETPYTNMGTGYPDLVVKPIPGTLRPVPWHEGTVLAVGATYEESGERVRVDPRTALEKVVDRAGQLGYEVKVGTELEFFLLDPETLRPRDVGIQVYGIARASAFEHVLGPIRNLCTEFGVPIEVSNPEYAPGQFEVNIHYGDALGAADNAVLFRSAVKEIAAREGLVATFMAKPFSDLSGNGFHVHQSLWRDGRNAFSDGGKLSELGRHYLGGLRRYMPEMALFGAPNPNSYRRRAPYTFCPTNNSWGLDNRTVGIRLIEGREEAVRIEQRDGSADANPYLIIAAQVAAGLEGIDQELDPGPPFVGDAYAAEEEFDPLPRSVPEAIAAVRHSELAAKTFDPDLVEILVGMAEREQGFVAAEVTEVERRRYLEAY